jgi:hypothetical protein
VKYSIYTKVSDELIICNNCFSAIKAVGRYGQVNLLSGSRKQVQKWNPRHCRTWVLCKVFSRDSRMPSPTSRQSCVANHLTDIFDSVLTYCPTNSSGYRHGPCVTLSMVSAKGKSAKLNSHYGINSGEIVCLNRVTVMRECSFLNVSSIPALTAYEYRGYIISAWARPESTNGSTSVGIVYKRGQFGSIIQVQRIEGELFETKEQAEQHGIELCKEWIDKQKPEFNRRVG